VTGPPPRGQRGILLEVTAEGRTWHRPLKLEQPPGPALQVIFSPSNDPADGSFDALRLRPAATPQNRFALVVNHGEHDLTAVVEIPGVGVATAPVAAGGSARLVFAPAADAAKGPPPTFTEQLNVEIREANDRVAPT